MKFRTKATLISLFCLFTFIGVKGQTPKTAYFMKSSHVRAEMNPAFRPDRGYVGFPGLANVAADGHSNFLTFNNLYYNKGGEYLSIFDLDDLDMVLSRFSDDSRVALDAKADLLSAGFYNKRDGFWNFNLTARGNVSGTVPKSVFEMISENYNLKNGMTNDYLVEKTDLRATFFMELGVGYSHSLFDNRLTVGARAKLLQGVADAHLDINHLSATVRMSEDRTYMKTSSEMAIRGSGVKMKYSDEGYFDEIDTDNLRYEFAGWGFGLDLGAEYDLRDLIKGLKISVGVTDIGVIKWNKKNTINLEPVITGFEAEIDNYIKGEESLDVIEKIFSDIADASRLKDSGQEAYSSSLYCNYNIGAEYSFLNDKLSGGVLFSRRGDQFNATNSFTIMFNARPVHWFSGSLSYSFSNDSRGDAVGLALNFTPAKVVHFFVASDYMFGITNFKKKMPKKANLLNAQVGISIPIGQRR